MGAQRQLVAVIAMCGVCGSAGFPPYPVALLGEDGGRRWLPLHQQEDLSPPHAISFVQGTGGKMGMIRNLLQRVGNFFSKKKLATESETKTAIESYVKAKEGLNLECLQHLRLPLTQTALVGLNGDDALYRPRHRVLPRVDLSILDSKYDSISPLFKEMFGTSFSLSVHGKERIDGIVQKKQVPKLPQTKRRRLLVTLLVYILLDMRSMPQIDPLLLSLLMRMTTSSCGKQEKRKIKVNANGKTIKVKGIRIMLVAWTELVKSMVRIGGCSSSSSDANCALLIAYIQWKDRVTEQLNKVSVLQDHKTEAGSDGTESAVDRTVSDEEVQVLVDRVLHRIENNLLFANTMMKMKFRWLINFLGKRKSVRKMILKFSGKLSSKLFGVKILGGKAQKEAMELKMSPAARYGFTLFYGMQKEGEVLGSTGQEGLSKLMGQLVRTFLKKMWGSDTSAKGPQGQSLIQKAGNVSTVVGFMNELQNKRTAPDDSWILSQRLSYPCGDNRFVSRMKGYILPQKTSDCEAASISLIQTGKNLSSKISVGVSGVAALIFGILGVMSGGISMLFPALFIVGGLLLCLFTVITSLMDLGIVPTRQDGESAGQGDREPLQQEPYTSYEKEEDDDGKSSDYWGS
ncbi:conserved hypothetical protein [Neospora caninum Liverpool]|uniref:Transmembrane protein n=1 Tax=Neospora caninum (strain Liverpool) TaxID=572307 RepID=F0VM44_NEOCL|nr:conserved hypothetical protein [Neospora caninum Liverpool]CBZ54322.1 conserved hypothetical protein [Neospora caninum Liverpool]|eukprot:XP_003884353.1 conserved hypothetical protein [Neospora caninum Liverpool]